MSFRSRSPAAPDTVLHGDSPLPPGSKAGRVWSIRVPPHTITRARCRAVVGGEMTSWAIRFVHQVCASPGPGAGLGARHTPENRTDIAAARSGRVCGGGSGGGRARFFSCLLDVLSSQSQDGRSSLLPPSSVPPDRQSPGCSGADSALAPRAVGKEGRRFSRQHFLFS